MKRLTALLVVCMASLLAIPMLNASEELSFQFKRGAPVVNFTIDATCVTTVEDSVICRFVPKEGSLAITTIEKMLAHPKVQKELKKISLGEAEAQAPLSKKFGM